MTELWSMQYSKDHHPMNLFEAPLLPFLQTAKSIQHVIVSSNLLVPPHDGMLLTHDAHEHWKGILSFLEVTVQRNDKTGQSELIVYSCGAYQSQV